MNDLIIASSPQDARALDAVENHHAQLAGALAQHVGRVLALAGNGQEADTSARDELVAWCDRELVPHALAEEKALYPAGLAMAQARLLVEAMLAEHGVITGLVDELRTADPVRAAAAGYALQVLFGSHLAKENEQLLPLLVAAPDVSVVELLDGMHELLGGHAASHADSQDSTHAHPDAGADRSEGGHTCGCGGHDEAGYPELDARAVPHAIRHATVFGALDAVQPGGGMVLVAPHDPLPLLAQAEQRAPGAFEVSYLERGPEAWRLLFRRR
ncbi:MAG TPA: DUF2249 domain-containing protein [Marmoricola sp.]|nr:DUF2249 domain-containing protein [Marmoricola sp.]